MVQSWNAMFEIASLLRYSYIDTKHKSYVRMNMLYHVFIHDLLYNVDLLNDSFYIRTGVCHTEQHYRGGAFEAWLRESADTTNFCSLSCCTLILTPGNNIKYVLNSLVVFPTHYKPHEYLIFFTTYLKTHVILCVDRVLASSCGVWKNVQSWSQWMLSSVNI